MRYLGWLFPTFFIAEIISIVLVSQWLGGWTLLLMLVQFMAGLFLMRNLGFSNVLLAGESLRHNPQGLSAYQLMWPIRFVIASILLLSPGFASTLLAVGLMLPLKAGPKIKLNAQHTQQTFHRHPHDTQADSDIIDGEYREVKPSAPPLEDRHSS